MNIKALVTTLVLGTSSVALADHTLPIAPTAPVAQEIRDHRLPIARPGYQRWTVLSSGRLYRGSHLVNVNSWMQLDKLKLEANRGSMFIDKVIVTFANGRTQTLEVDKWISMNRSALVDIGGRRTMSRRVSSIAVYGRGGARSTLKVLAT